MYASLSLADAHVTRNKNYKILRLKVRQSSGRERLGRTGRTVAAKTRQRVRGGLGRRRGRNRVGAHRLRPPSRCSAETGAATVGFPP
jgi:hypothetical protein